LGARTLPVRIPSNVPGKTAGFSLNLNTNDLTRNGGLFVRLFFNAFWPEKNGIAGRGALLSKFWPIQSDGNDLLFLRL
jgi:hypothetical protein